MIRKFYDRKNKPVFFRLRISAPDGRFAQDDIVGGITEATALFEARKLNELEMNVDIFPEKLAQEASEENHA